MMKVMLKILGVLLLLNGCMTITIPDEFVYKEVQTRNFKLASWQKITNPYAVFKVYIEGDGHSFDSYGRPTGNPTPKGTLLREIAFGDKSHNVIYMARPCQFVKDANCSQRHWTSARFAREVVEAEFEAVSKIVGGNEVVLIGFSGGAQVAGLISVAKVGLNVKKIVTIGGNLDHLAWTDWHNLSGLSESLNLADYKKEYFKIPQVHFVGKKDMVVPKELVYEFVGDSGRVVEVDATHSSGWEDIYQLVWDE